MHLPGFALVVCVSGWLQPQNAHAGAVTVSAARELESALKPVTAIWTATGPTVAVEWVETPKLLKQIQAPAKSAEHVWVVTADAAWLAKAGVTLQLVGEITGDSLVAVGAKGAFSEQQQAELGEALLGPGVPAQERLATLARLVMGPIAVPHPASGAAGANCRAALTKLDVWKPLEASLVFKKSPSETLASVAEGESALGIVFASQAAGDDSVDYLGEISDQIQPPAKFSVFHGGGPKAKKLVEFLTTPSASKALAKAGLSWKAK